MITLGQV